jgi:putative phage-type endonuclease
VARSDGLVHPVLAEGWAAAVSALAVRVPGHQGTPAWLDARRDVVGSSDIPVITGNSPYRTSLFSLWAVKTRKAEPDPIDPETQELFDLGHAMEDVIAARYSLVTDRPVKRVRDLLVSKSTPWHGASLDRVSARKGERRIIEVKWVPHKHWLTDGPEPVPAHVQDQVQWQLMVTGYDVADVAVLNGSHVEVHEVGPSERYQADLRYLAKHLFWDHVERGEAPPIDGSESTRATLGRMYPRETLGLLDPTPELAALAFRIRDAKAAMKAAEAAKGEPENVMRSLLGESAGVRDDEAGYRVSWTQNKPTTKVAWEAVVKDLRAHVTEGNRSGRHVTEGDIDQAIADATTTTEGARVLRTYFRDEETGKWL